MSSGRQLARGRKDAVSGEDEDEVSRRSLGGGSGGGRTAVASQRSD